MTAFALGEAAAMALGRLRPQGSGVRLRPPAKSGALHRTGAPVRRDSVEAGTFEEHFFAVPAKGEPDRLLRTARAALDAGRRLKWLVRTEGRVLSPAETALAGLTAAAVWVYEEICTLARLNAGRVFPTYDRLAASTARPRHRRAGPACAGECRVPRRAVEHAANYPSTVAAQRSPSPSGGGPGG